MLIKNEFFFIGIQAKILIKEMKLLLWFHLQKLVFGLMNFLFWFFYGFIVFRDFYSRFFAFIFIFFHASILIIFGHFNYNFFEFWLGHHMQEEEEEEVSLLILPLKNKWKSCILFVS